MFSKCPVVFEGSWARSFTRCRGQVGYQCPSSPGVSAKVLLGPLCQPFFDASLRMRKKWANCQLRIFLDMWHVACIFFMGWHFWMAFFHVEVSWNRGYPSIIHFNGIFPYKPSILGYPHLWKAPCSKKRKRGDEPPHFDPCHTCAGVIRCLCTWETRRDRRCREDFRGEIILQRASWIQPHDGSVCMVDWCDNMNGVYWWLPYLAYIRIRLGTTILLEKHRWIVSENARWLRV